MGIAVLALVLLVSVVLVAQIPLPVPVVVALAVALAVALVARKVWVLQRSVKRRYGNDASSREHSTRERRFKTTSMS